MADLLLNDCFFIFSLRTGSIVIFFTWIVQHIIVAYEARDYFGFGREIWFTEDERKMVFVSAFLYIVAAIVGLVAVFKDKRVVIIASLVLSAIGILLGFFTVFTSVKRGTDDMTPALTVAVIYTIFPLYFWLVLFSYYSKG